MSRFGDVSGWVPLILTIVFVLAWYLSYSASRLDRLHHRVESTRAALDAQLARRAAAAMEVAHVLDPATALLLTEAASAALDAGGDGASGGSAGAGAGGSTAAGASGGAGPTGAGAPGEAARAVEEAENDLGRALHAAFADVEDVLALRTDPVAGESLDLLGQACLRVQLARRFHNDAVAAAQRVRRKPVVRWARLAGHAEWPQMVELDDTPPAGLLDVPV